MLTGENWLFSYYSLHKLKKVQELDLHKMWSAKSSSIIVIESHPTVIIAIRFQNDASVNFNNILRAAFAPIFLCQKSTNIKCKFKKYKHKHFRTKKLRAKYWWNCPMEGNCINNELWKNYQFFCNRWMIRAWLTGQGKGPRAYN